MENNGVLVTFISEVERLDRISKALNQLMLGCITSPIVWSLGRLMNVIRDRLNSAAPSRTLGNPG